MPGTGCDAPLEPGADFPHVLFDDAAYEREALQLPPGQTEDALDRQLADEARARGLDVHQQPYPEARDTATTMSMLTLSSDYRSSMSVRSHASHSTGLTSPHSRTSRDGQSLDFPAVPAPAALLPGRQSLSLESYHAISERAPQEVPLSRSSSTSTLGSSFSLPIGRLSMKRKRPTSFLSIFRRDSASSCSSRSKHSHAAGGDPDSAVLPCGHNLSNLAVRIHVRESAAQRQWPPRCCGKPIPEGVLAAAMGKPELERVATDMSKSPPPSKARWSVTSSPATIDQRSIIDVETPTTAGADDRTVLIRTHEDEKNLEEAMRIPSFRSLRTQQVESATRIVQFESRQLQSLTCFQRQAEVSLASEHAREKEERLKQHEKDLEELEDRQLNAELEMSQAHVEERQNVATALKYMQAYCSGGGQGEIKHTVTEEDRRRLQRQQDLQNNLDRRQESAINVLRAKQERNLKARIEKQNAALAQMDRDFDARKQALRERMRKESQRLDELVQARRKRAGARWGMEIELWRKRCEDEGLGAVPTRLPLPDWPECPSLDETTDPSGSLDEKLGSANEAHADAAVEAAAAVAAS